MFNIDRFKSKLNSYGGPANPNLFEVRIGGKISATNSDTFAQDVPLFCHSTSLPGINIVTHNHRPDNLGLPAQMPIGIEPERLDCIFLVDDKKNVLSFFHRWMQSIYNYDAGNGKLSARSGSTNGVHTAYEINYYSDYTRWMQISHYSVDQQAYNWVFNDVYPVDIGTMRASWSDNGGFMELPVHFSYSTFSVDSAGEDGSTRVVDVQRLQTALRN